MNHTVSFLRRRRRLTVQRITQYPSSEEDGVSPFNVYPNPVSDIVQVEFNDNTQVEITISDLQGMVILSQTSLGVLHSVSMSGIPAGIYLLKVEYDGHVQARQIFKN